MAYYVITYDLISQRDYQRLTDELFELKAAPVALSVWLLERYHTSAFALRDHLLNYMDDDDRIVVIQFSKQPAWRRALQSGASWIEARFS